MTAGHTLCLVDVCLDSHGIHFIIFVSVFADIYSFPHFALW